MTNNFYLRKSVSLSIVGRGGEGGFKKSDLKEWLLLLKERRLILISKNGELAVSPLTHSAR